jgi:hypothetical protein
MTKKTPKEKFLEIKSYEEFDRRRSEFKGLKVDVDIKRHLAKIFPKAYAPEGVHREVYKKK